jgi:hypothetical protein
MYFVPLLKSITELFIVSKDPHFIASYNRSDSENTPR